MFSTIADKLAIEVEQVENFILEGDQVSNVLATPTFVYNYVYGAEIQYNCLVLQLEMMENFFKADGSVVLMFFYQRPTVEDGQCSLHLVVRPNERFLINHNCYG